MFALAQQSAKTRKSYADVNSAHSAITPDLFFVTRTSPKYTAQLPVSIRKSEKSESRFGQFLKAKKILREERREKSSEIVYL